MKKMVGIEDLRGGVTSGYTSEDVKIGETVAITAQDENGRPFEATGKVIDIIEL